MGKYANNCLEMFLREDERPRAHRPGTWIFGQEYRYQTEYFQGTPCLVEYLPILAGGPKGAKSDWAPKEVFVKPNVERDGHKGGPFQQTRHEADLMTFFLGTDPEHPDDLGGHIEYHIGTGEDEEVYEFDEPTCIFIPKGVPNCPVVITDVRRWFMQINILTQPSKEACFIEHLYHQLPPK